MLWQLKPKAIVMNIPSTADIVQCSVEFWGFYMARLFLDFGEILTAYLQNYARIIIKLS